MRTISWDGQLEESWREEDAVDATRGKTKGKPRQELVPFEPRKRGESAVFDFI